MKLISAIEWLGTLIDETTHSDRVFFFQNLISALGSEITIIESQKMFLENWFTEIEANRNLRNMEKVAQVAQWIRECV